MPEFVVPAVPGLQYTGHNTAEVAALVGEHPQGQVEVSTVSDTDGLTLRIVMYGGPDNGGADFDITLAVGDWVIYTGGDSPHVVTAAEFDQRWLRLRSASTR